MKKIIYTCFLFISIVQSCDNKDDIAPIAFNGITSRDELGAILSNDSTDWCLTDAWNNTESDLFDDGKKALCDTASNDYLIFASPNPCSGILNLHTLKPQDCSISYRIVDRHYNILASRDSSTMNSIGINLDLLGVVNDTVRMYYKFVRSDCELRGHGDIVIE